jgi:hypothetical protein
MLKNITRLATALQNSDEQAIRLIEIDLVEYLARKARSTDTEQSEFKVTVSRERSKSSTLSLTIWFDQEIDGKIYQRRVNITVSPCFLQEFNAEYQLEEITLAKALVRYNYLPGALSINEYLLKAD